MCGIAGQIGMAQNVEINSKEVNKMLQMIYHRGPDGQGLFESKNTIFGMRRLSIIDLETGWQPIYNEDKSLVCCCNGEIYNYMELQEELKNKGHVFSTNSDVEVILHLFEEEGESFVNRLNGMFSFALYDQNRNRMLIYRDRMGKKPLFYCEQNGIFYFASEIKCILTCDNITRKCNYTALDYILSYNYIPNNLTSFENIYKLMPGEYMVIENGKYIINTYWKLPSSESTHVHEDDCIDYVDSILQDSVKIRLRSDVPVGAFLSGGVDSSLVVGKASRFIDELQTFSIGFEENSYDETKYSDCVANLFHTKHINKIVNSDFFSLLPTTIWLNDNPHGDVSFLPTYILADMTSKYVKTVLTGDGGDELFGGYDKYLNFLKNENTSVLDFFENNSVFNKEQKKLLYTPKMVSKISGEDSLSYINLVLESSGIDIKNKEVDKLNILLFLETKLLLDGNNLVKPDRMGMGNSIEARMPLLDYRLVEYVSKLPSNIKVKDGETKYLLKKVASHLLPNDIVYRKKQMFTVPIGEWLKNSLKTVAYDILFDSRTVSRGIFNVEYIKYMFNMHITGKENYTRQLRLLIIIELWHRIYIDQLFTDKPQISDLM